MLPQALTQKWGKEKMKTPRKSMSKDFTITPNKTTLPASTGQSKKKLHRSSLFFEAPKIEDVKFDEEIQELSSKYKLDPEGIKKAVDGLINFTSTNPKLKNKLFGDEQFPIFLQINSIKIPKAHAKIARIALKHSMYTADSDICLIVPEVKGIPNKKHEEHLEYYEKLLAKKGVNNIKKILTFHEFRTEYETFELKKRLAELYDVFLVDGRLSGKAVKKCGKIFYSRRKIPTSIKLQASKLREHIETTLRKSPLYLHSRGDSFSVQIGHSKMDSTDLVENVVYAVKGLDSVFPGGFGNIRNLSLTTSSGITIPIYMTLKSKNEVAVPKEQRAPVETFTGELTTKLNSYVKVKSTGEVTVVKISDNSKTANKSKKDVTQDQQKKSNDNLIKVGGEGKKRKLTGVPIKKTKTGFEKNSNLKLSKHKNKSKQ